MGLLLLEQSRGIKLPDAVVLIGGASYAIYLLHHSTINLAAMMLAALSAVTTEAMFLAAITCGVSVEGGFDAGVGQPLRGLLRSGRSPR